MAIDEARKHEPVPQVYDTRPVRRIDKAVTDRGDAGAGYADALGLSRRLAGLGQQGSGVDDGFGLGLGAHGAPVYRFRTAAAREVFL